MSTCSAANQEAALTLNKEQEADDAHGGDDEARDNEGQAPVRGDPVTCDQRAQDVSHRGVRVPQTHDESTPDRKTRHRTRVNNRPTELVEDP